MKFTDKERTLIIQALMYLEARLNLLPDDSSRAQDLVKRFREESE